MLFFVTLFYCNDIDFFKTLFLCDVFFEKNVGIYEAAHMAGNAAK